MDISRLNQGQRISIIAAIVLIICLFLSWTEDVGVAQTAFDAFSGMDVIMLLIALVVIGFSAAPAFGAANNMTFNIHLVIAGLGMLVAGWCLGWNLEDSSASIGSWIGLFAAIGITAGGWMSSEAVLDYRRRTRPPGSGDPAGHI